MVGAPRSFIEHVGHVLFPRGPKDLIDSSRCPACFVALPNNLVCVSCGLDMNHPDAARLRDESLNVVALMDARLELIGKIRFETAAERTRIRDELRLAERAALEAAAAQRAARSTAALAPPTHTVAAEAPPTPLAAPVYPQPTSAPDVAAAASAAAAATSSLASPLEPAPRLTEYTASGVNEAPTARSHTGIQVILLIVGVSLLSVGAIFFLIYAFISFGLIWRSAIIATITIASIVGATMVKKRGLSATAEALSALAVVLVVLDIYAVRANELLVVGDSAGRVYWGAALIVASLGFMFWHRASKLTLVNVLGFAAFPPAAALLIAGLANGDSPNTLVLIPMVAFSAATLIYLTAAHGNYRGVAERVIMIVYAFVSLSIGFLSALASLYFPLRLSDDDSTAGWLLLLGAVAAAHSVAAQRAGFGTIIRNSFAVISGITVATAVWNLIETDAPIGAFAVVATLTALAVLSEGSGRYFGAASRNTTHWASLGVWAITAIALISPLASSLAIAMQYVTQSSLRRITPASAPFDVSDNGWPQLAILSVPVIMTLAWWATGQLRARLPLVLASAGAALALAAPLAGTLLPVIAVWLALAALAVVAIGISQRRRPGLRTSTVILIIGGSLPLVLAYVSGWSSYGTWLLASMGTAAILFAARYLVTAVAVRATMLGTAMLALLLAAAGFGEQLQFALTATSPNPLESWLTVSVLAVIISARSLWPRTREVTDLERRVLWWMGFVSTALAGSILWTSTVDGAPFPDAPLALSLNIISVVVAVLLVTILSITMLRSTTFSNTVSTSTASTGTGVTSPTQTRTAERLVAAAALAPALVWALDSASRTAGLGAIAIELAPATASVLVGALSMTLRVRQHHTLVRRIGELSALTVAAITTASTILQPHETHWLIALLVSITLLLASISADGIFGSHSPRRFVIWGAVAFSTWALWLRLDQSRVEALEAYVLPLAAIVLAISIFTARAELRESSLRSAPFIALAGLLIAVVPLALNAASGSGTSTLIISALCGALLLAAAFIAPRPSLLSFWGISVVAAATGLITATAARTLYSFTAAPSAQPNAEFMLIGAVTLLTVASFGLAYTDFARVSHSTLWQKSSPALLGAAVVLLYAVEGIIAIDLNGSSTPLSSIRIVALVTLGAALLVTNARFAKPPLTRTVAYVAFTFAVLVALGTYVVSATLYLEFWLIAAILGFGMIARALMMRSRENAMLEPRTLWWAGFSVTALAAASLWSANLGGTAFASGAGSPAPFMLDLSIVNVVGAVLVLTALSFTIFGRGASTSVPEAIAAAAALAPATAWLLDSASRMIELPTVAIELAPATASVLVGAFSMILRLRDHDAPVRRASEISALAVAAITTVSAILEPQHTPWLIALLVSVTVLLSSISRDGVFGSASLRRHAIWGAVAFGTWALWLRLDQSRVEALEAYVLPLAAIVIALSIFIARAELRQARLASAPAITLAGLLIAILPLALNAASGDGLRTLVIAGLCGALLLTAAFVEPRSDLIDFWGVAIIASAIGLVVTTASRAIMMIADSRGMVPELDAGLLATAGVLALASFGAAASGFSHDDNRPRWAMLSEVLLGSALVLLYAIETLALVEAVQRDQPIDTIRIIVLVALGGALLVLAARPSTRPLTHRMSYLGFALASIVGAIAYFGDLVQPLEWVTVLIGVALLTHGGLRMVSDPDARSMRWLSAGLLILLAPSLIATFIDTASDGTQWRIVALGIVAVAIIVVGAWLKLKAPLVIATIVVLIHASHTFAPALISFYQLTSWWLWAVIGGAIVLFLGITLERRIRDLTTLNTKFSALR
ncbi:SCO7613 C-terminal domain-containing membrane protein [Rhodoglobus sp.]